jgi:SulP family sulfate permease
LFFGTANQLQTALEPETANRKYVVLSMYRVQSLDVTATHVLEQIKDRLEQNNAYLVFCDIPKGLPSGLKMKRFLKETGVVRPTEKAVAFRQLDEALEWIEAQELQEAAAEMGSVALELKNMPMFAKCSASDVAALESVVFRHSVKAGKRIFKAGGDDRDLFLIRQGRVRITIPLRKKDNYHMTTSGAGELIGSMGFIESRAHVADATALVDTEVYVLTPVRYAELVEQHPAIAMVIVSTLAKGLSSRLRSTIGEVQALRG